jgi:hypothetical protein
MIPVVQTVAFSYRNALYPWCVIRQLPRMQRVVVGRFRRRNEAEEFLSVLRRSNPDCTYYIVFDPPDCPQNDRSLSEWGAITEAFVPSVIFREYSAKS